MISTAEQSHTNISKHDAIVRKLILPSDCMNGYLVWIGRATQLWLSVKSGDESQIFSQGLRRNCEVLSRGWVLYTQLGAGASGVKF